MSAVRLEIRALAELAIEIIQALNAAGQPAAPLPCGPPENGGHLAFALRSRPISAHAAIASGSAPA